jgi:hypothetical protein
MAVRAPGYVRKTLERRGKAPDRHICVLRPAYAHSAYRPDWRITMKLDSPAVIDYRDPGQKERTPARRN